MTYEVFDTLLDGVLVIDEEKQVIYANEAATLLLGTPMKKLQRGIACYDLVQFDDLEMLCMPRGTWGKDEPTPYKELVFKSASGQTGRVQVSIRPEENGTNDVNRWIVYLRDVTLEEALHRKYRTELEMKAATIRELIETQDQLVQSSKVAMLGQIIPVISHELNNPLALILSSAEELVAMLDSKTVDMNVLKELSSYVYKGSKRIMGLSKQLKTFLHGPLSIEDFDYMDICSPIEAAVSFIHHFSGDKSVEIRNHIPKDLPYTLLDPTLIEQIAANLIRNSIDAIQESDMDTPGVIEIYGKHNPTSNTIIISFVDNGPGISPEVMRKLFTPFFTTKGVGKGTGLGLNICSAIAERHGGSLTVRSIVKQSTTFFLTLPVKTVAAELELEDGNLIFRDLKILLVDDEPLIRNIQKRLLSHLGCAIFEAADGKEALAMCKNSPPDVIITDLLMPGISGLEFAILARKLCPVARIILLTGSDPLASLKSEAAIFDGIITKPFPNDLIRKTILKVMKQDRVA